MATYFSSCGSNLKNYKLCLEYNVAGFISGGYHTGDSVYLIVSIRQRVWVVGAKGLLGEITIDKPWPDKDRYKSAFKVDWQLIEPVEIQEGLKKIYPNWGLVIKGKNNLESFQGKGLEVSNYLDEIFSKSKSIDKSTIVIKEPEKPITPMNPMKITPRELINHVDKYIESKGYRYQYDEIANFYLSLRTKPFVILAGISGTGKTQLPRKFAAALGFSKDQIIQVPVRPDWTDSSDLLGYTDLNGNFIQKELTIAIFKAKNDPTKPYFFILDEMNLARVEHYFSDFLSIIETRRRIGNEIMTDPILSEDMLKNAKNKNKFSAVGIPQNLFLIGTVNMDESTHTFSRKVLDRANTIEMNDINLEWLNSDHKSINSLSNISNDLFQTNFIASNELSVGEKNIISTEMKLLQDVNKILMKADLHFAYRVRDEVAFYLVINKKYELIDKTDAFDFQLVQKILPRINGSSERVQTVLIELLNLFENKDFNTSNFEIKNLITGIDEKNLKFKRASKKIIFMLKRFDDDRFTSFWL